MWQSSEHLTSVTPVTMSQTQNEVESANRTLPDDELARTAGVVLASVSHDTSAKFQQSAFLGLMRQLRDGDVVLEGNEMVARSSTPGWADDFHADAKGKGKERAQPASQLLQMTGSNIPASSQGWWNDRVINPMMQPSTANQDTSAAQAPPVDVTAENENDAYFRQDNAEYAEYWKGMHGAAPRLAQPATAQDAEWANLQQDWDNFEATATGIRALSNYQFQENNPYVLGNSSRTTHQHEMHANGYREMYDVSFKTLLVDR
jgi:peroxin-5